MKKILKCPVCDQLLNQENRSYKCENNHTFDLAKEGYLHLMQNAKKTAGDSKEMMTARRKFLASGYYEPLSDAVNEALLTAQTTQGSLIDIGCGEGYYLTRFQEQFAAENPDFYGLDISKLGVRLAAKKNPKSLWLVANFAKLPFTNHSIDTVLSMFAEYSVSEINRVLTENGTVIIVRAAADHLTELKNIIYPEIHEKTKAGAIKDFPGFSVHREIHSYKTNIQSTEDLLSLLLMTPHYWKIKPEGIENLKKHHRLEVTVSIEIDRLTRI
jgi:23S rRNA (guanine745-N1)-methyltransferase